MNPANKKIWSILACIFVISTLGFAQAGRGKGRLGGIVVDEKGAPVVVAKVTIEFEKGGLKGETTVNAKGEWGFLGLGSGQCIVTAIADGFLDTIVNVTVQQLTTNKSLTLVLKEDKEKKIRLQDQEALLELDKGNQFYTERKFDEALQIFQTFAAGNPNVYQIYFNIGDVFREKGEFEKANEQYTIGLEKAKEKVDILMQAKALASFGEVCLRQDKLKEAQEFFTQSIALNPKDEILAYNVAEIFFGRNQVDKAIEYYKLATQIKPDWSEPYLKMGYAYLNKGDMKLAVNSFNDFLKFNTDPAQAEVVKGLIATLTKAK